MANGEPIAHTLGTGELRIDTPLPPKPNAAAAAAAAAPPPPPAAAADATAGEAAEPAGTSCGWSVNKPKAAAKSQRRVEMQTERSSLTQC